MQNLKRTMFELYVAVAALQQEYTSGSLSAEQCYKLLAIAAQVECNNQLANIVVALDKLGLNGASTGLGALELIAKEINEVGQAFKERL